MPAEKSESYQPGGHVGGAALPSQESIDLLTKLLQEFHRRTTPTEAELPPGVKRDVAAVAAIVESLQNALALRPSAMTITGLTPNRGPRHGTTPITITGTRFLPGSTVFFGKNLGRNINVVSQTEIQVTTPPGTGCVDVIVNTLAGTARLVEGFTYQS